MWIFCKQGFFSVVEHRNMHDCVLIRACFKGDLERLLESCVCISRGKDHGVLIEHTPEADYPWRMAWPKSGWVAMMQKIAADVDYDNFKNRVHEGHGSPRDRAYMGCWMELRRGQEEAERRQG